MSRISLVCGRAVPIRGDDIDTDRIIPARYLKSITFEGLEAHLFADDRAAAAEMWPGSSDPHPDQMWRGSLDPHPDQVWRGSLDPHPHPIDDPRFAGAAIMIVNRNFGCGSSREHAPQAIYRRGIRAVIGESFSEIFFGNSVALGLPCVKVSRDEAIALMDAVEADSAIEIVVDIQAGQVRAGTLAVGATLPSSVRDAFMSGDWDATGLLLAGPEEVDAVAAKLPYLRW